MIRIFLLTALLMGAFPGCLQDGGTEIPNELWGKEFIAGKGPAADAEVKLVPVGYVPGAPGGDSGRSVLLSGKTDAHGRFAFRDVAPGQYNLIASKDGMQSFRDSLSVTGGAQSLAPDTLRAPGSVTGIVELEPQHEPRSATVQVLGTTVFVNVAQDGRFLLKDLGAGEYRLRVVTVQPEYVPLYLEFTVHAGRTDTFPEPLRPFFTGTPAVRGLTVAPGPNGTLTLRWSKPVSGKVKSYLIYRDTAGTLLPTNAPLRRVDDTFYVDTIYSRTPGTGQYPYLDTLSHSFSYRVKILDQSGDPGPSYGFVEATAIPPTLYGNTTLWKLAPGRLPVALAKGLVVFRDRLWLMSSHGGGGKDSVHIWSSSDAASWKLESVNTSFPGVAGQMIAFQEKLWILGMREAATDEGAPAYNNSATVLWNSPDGLAWEDASGGVLIPGRANCGFAAFDDKLWLAGGTGIAMFAVEDIQSSLNGTDWTLEKDGFTSPVTQGSLIAFGAKLWIIGGGSAPHGKHNRQLLSSADGKEWSASPAAPGLLARFGHTLTAHAGRLWLIGGAANQSDTAASTPMNDVWSSPDGLTWDMMDARAPFDPRAHHLSVSFQGRLWVMGGDSYGPSGEPTAAADVWYRREP